MNAYHYTFVHHSSEYVDIEGDYACVGVGSLWTITVPSTQFSCEPKLLNCVFKKTIREQNHWVGIKDRLHHGQQTFSVKGKIWSLVHKHFFSLDNSSKM